MDKKKLEELADELVVLQMFVTEKCQAVGTEPDDEVEEIQNTLNLIIELIDNNE